MRQRKAKDLQKRLEECSGYMISPENVDRNRAFGREAELYLEIGCGKGNFIIKKAQDNPEADFIAIEGQETVILRAMEKLKAYEDDRGADLPNLKFMLTFVNSMSDFFGEGELAGIYLNFSDPWPKERHKKRRLTYRGRLEDYARALKKGGFIEFKTDNDALFDFTLEEIEAAGFEAAEMTRDLHKSEFDSRHTMTEYEEKFKGQGKNINYVKITV